MGVFGIDHVAFRSPDPAGLRAFYARLLGAVELEGEHMPLRVGSTTLVFFDGAASAGEDELAFDADAEGFARALEAARQLDALEREPVEHTPFSHGFLVRDPGREAYRGRAQRRGRVVAVIGRANPAPR